MARPDDAARDAVSQIEHALLAALCQSSLEPEDRTAILQRLEHYHFVVPDHEIVYRAILTASAAHPRDLPATLTRMVTRMGFPDIETIGYFSTEPSNSGDLRKLLSRL